MGRAGLRIAAQIAALSAATLVICAAPIYAQSSAESFAAKIRSELARGQLEAALRDAQLAVEDYPHSSLLFRLTGMALDRAGQSAGARSALRRAIALDPGMPKNYFDLALVDLDANRYSDAAAEIKTFLALEPNSAQAHLLLGRADEKLGDASGAADQYKAAIVLAPQMPLVHYALGLAEEHEGKLEEALAAYEREIVYNPGFDGAYWHAGRIDREEGRLAQSEKFYKRAIHLNPDGFEGHYGLGVVLLSEHKPKEAIAQLNRAVAIRLTDVRAHQALAKAYHALEEFGDEQRELLIAEKLRETQATEPEKGNAGNGD